ncbi:MAG: LPP20 family lipoprotein [Flavobacteriales bacterium]
MKYLWLYIILALGILSCGSTKELTKTPAENFRPDWAFNRPINSSYYIGIGSANKLAYPNDYSVIAKKNALTDMSSEITVKISGESFFHTIDNNNEYSDEFQSMIRSSFEEEIENYEIIDSWENDTEFWIFTRISKAAHAQAKADKKAKVLDQAFESYILAKEYAQGNKPADALDLLSKALLDMKEYWAEVNMHIENGREIHLDNSIYNEIRSICSAMEMKTNLDKVELTYLNGFASDVSVAVKNEARYLAGIPIMYKFSSEKYLRPKRLYTSNEGVVTIHAENFDGQTSNFQLEIWIDFEDLLRNDDAPEIGELLLNSINQSRVSLPIQITLPSFYFYELDGDSKTLSKTFKNELQKEGFRIVSSPELADLRFSLESSVKEGGTAQGFQVAFLDFSVVLEDQENQTQVFADSYVKIKGIHMSDVGAMSDAVNNATKKIRKEIVPKMIKVLL